MTLDDLKKLATGNVLLSLDRVIVPRLIRVVYLLGLAGIGLWALDHLFDAFRFGFGNGLWGLLEVVIFGLLAFVALRALCEIVLIYYKANEKVVSAAMEPPSSASLIDDVAGAIEDLAQQEDQPPAQLTRSRPTRAATTGTRSASAAKPAAKTAAKPASKPSTPKARSAPRRTARRTPRPKSTN